MYKVTMLIVNGLLILMGCLITVFVKIFEKG